jgi:hypothetical protein
MSAFFAAISDTGGGSASSATTAATAAAGAGPNVYARAVARGESLLSTGDHSSAGGEGARVVSPVNGGVTAGPDNSFSVGAAVMGEGGPAAAAASGGGVREDQDIPSQHICPLVQEPPFDAVHFDVPSANGTTTTTPTSQQVYEKSALYRFVGTQGDLSLRRTLTHPFTRVRIARNLAWDCVSPVDPALQETLHRERSALGLLLEDDNPLNDNDRSQYDRTMRGCVARCVYFLCIL